MGKFNSAADQNIQTLPGAVGVHVAGAATCGSTDEDCDYSTPAYWNGHLYVSGVNDHVKDFVLSNSLLTGPVSLSPQTFGYPGSVPAVSANETRMESSGRSNQPKPFFMLTTPPISRMNSTTVNRTPAATRSDPG
jgi:hypothetical protein